MTGTGRGSDGYSRAQSSPIAIVLVFGLVIASTTIIVVAGGSAISSTQNQLNTESAELQMSQLDSEISTVGVGSADGRKIDLGTTNANAYSVNQSAGRITVTSDTLGPILDTKLGKIIYESEDGQRIAYQGGGVWRGGEGDGSVMVSPPELQYRGGTLTLRLITVDGDGALSGTAVVSHNNSTKIHPNADKSLQNPVTGDVEVTIQSDYYQAWAEYFRTRTSGGGVSVNPSNKEVTLLLSEKSSTRTVSNAVSVGAGSGTLRIQSGNTIVVSGYDSSAVSAAQKGEPSGVGTSGLETTMNVDFNGNAKIGGDLATTGSVSFGGGKSGVGGDLWYGKGSVNCGKYVDGDCYNNPSVDTPQDLNNEISDEISQRESTNDNGAEACISESDGLRYGDGPCSSSSITLQSGNYYVDNQDLRVGSGQKLILDTTSGDIEIALDNDRQLALDGNVTVVGDGRVNIYATDQVAIASSSSKIWNRGWDAEQFWVYCDADCQIDVKKGIFNGVVYAPPGPGGNSADLEVRNGAKVYGAIVAGGGSNAEIGQNSEIYFDQQLESSTVFQTSTGPSITYLHLSENKVNVTSE